MVRTQSFKKPRDRAKDNNAIANITEWKSVIIDELVNDDDIGKLLHYNTEDALFKEPLSDEQKRDLYDSKIFGYRYNPKIVDEASQFITVGISRFAPSEGFRRISDQFTDGFIYFYILVNQQNMKMLTGYRQDLIADSVHRLFHNNEKIGIGNLKWANLVETWEHNSKLGGYTIGFRVTDFT